MKETCTVYVSSDLHMSAKEDADDSIVSLMRLQRPVFDELTSQLIEKKPDLLILCGDNTQSGRHHDMAMLRRYLRKLVMHGIEVIMIPGNHDFDACTEDEYERMFFSLLNMDEKDPSSLSYLRRKGPYTFFAMDDHEKPRSPRGVFQPETVSWLDAKLKQETEAGQIPVFLSHHNLHPDAWMSRPEFYTIAPSGIRELLSAHGVRLAFSGHLHDPRIYQSELSEIITPAPLGGAHMYGKLLLNERKAQYTLEKIAFGDPWLKEKVREKDAMVYEKRRAAFARYMNDLCEEDREKALDGLMRWLFSEQRGTLAQMHEQLIHDEGLLIALRALKGTAYEAWIKALSDPASPSACHLVTDL